MHDLRDRLKNRVPLLGKWAQSVHVRSFDARIQFFSRIEFRVKSFPEEASQIELTNFYRSRDERFLVFFEKFEWFMGRVLFDQASHVFSTFFCLSSREFLYQSYSNLWSFAPSREVGDLYFISSNLWDEFLSRSWRVTYGTSFHRSWEDILFYLE